MGLVLTTPPTGEPVSVSEAVTRLRLDVSNVLAAPAAPTVALASPVAPGNVDNGAHRYRVTFVTSDGETDGGVVSTAVTVADKTINGQVSLTAIPIGTTGVTARKIYRTAAAGSVYLLLATLSNNTATTYTDNTADSGLGAGVPSTSTAFDPSEIAPLITAARQEVEETAQASLLTQTWTATFDRFPDGRQSLPLVRGPVVSITSVHYLDKSGVDQTMSSALYTLERNERSDNVRLVANTDWPATVQAAGAVTVVYVAGYGLATDSPNPVPAPLRLAMLLRIGDLYRNREAQIIERAVAVQNEAFDSMMGQYIRTPRF